MVGSSKRSIEITANVARIVEAFVAKNNVSAAELPGLIASVYAALDGGAAPTAADDPPPPKPAVPISKAVSHTHVTCLDCGKRFKSLRGHLRSAHDLTPEAYRQKWDLRPDHPMVAPEYASVRSRLSKQFGLGGRQAPRRRQPAEALAADASAAGAETNVTRLARGRRRNKPDA